MIVMQIIVIIISINLHQHFEPEVNSNSEILYSHKCGYEVRIFYFAIVRITF